MIFRRLPVARPGEISCHSGVVEFRGLERFEWVPKNRAWDACIQGTHFEKFLSLGGPGCRAAFAGKKKVEGATQVESPTSEARPVGGRPGVTPLMCFS